MQNQHTTVLIFAQSARFLAQSATQAGFRVWVADCFGDQETRSISARYQQLKPINELSIEEVLTTLLSLSQGEECLLIFGSGIESLYPFLDKLPNTIKLAGNSFKTIEKLKTPHLFFELLSQLNLPYPNTVFKAPKASPNWLVKSASGIGGSHIQNMETALPLNEHYFQRFISGQSGSVLFLANEKSAQLLSINQQLHSTNRLLPFQLGGIDTPWHVSTAHKQQLALAINKLTTHSKLVGLNSLDFIISVQNKLMLLEINPRPSASVELVGHKDEVLLHHINACQGQLPSPAFIPTHKSSSLRYLFATDNLLIPDDMYWPEESHDRPIAGSIINKDEPICTIIVQSNNVLQSEDLHSTVKREILDQLIPLA